MCENSTNMIRFTNISMYKFTMWSIYEYDWCLYVNQFRAYFLILVRLRRSFDNIHVYGLTFCCCCCSFSFFIIFRIKIVLYKIRPATHREHTHSFFRLLHSFEMRPAWKLCALSMSFFDRRRSEQLESWIYFYRDLEVSWTAKHLYRARVCVCFFVLTLK